jgi:hypothetical protein
MLMLSTFKIAVITPSRILTAFQWIELAPLHPDIRLLFQGKAASAPATATTGGYPPA